MITAKTALYFLFVAAAFAQNRLDLDVIEPVGSPGTRAAPSGDLPRHLDSFLSKKLQDAISATGDIIDASHGNTVFYLEKAITQAKEDITATLRATKKNDCPAANLTELRSEIKSGYAEILREISLLRQGNCSNQQVQYCPPNPNQRCRVYWFVGKIETWTNAQQVCQQSDGDLVTVRNSDNSNFLNSLAKTYGATYYWIGLNDIVTEGRHVWISGANARFKNWRNGEPNGGRKENCGEAWVRSRARPEVEEGWNDADCSEMNPFICELRRAKSKNGVEEDEDV